MADNQNKKQNEELPSWTEYAEYTEDIWDAYQKYIPTILTRSHGKFSIEDAIDWNDMNPAKKIDKASVELATRWDTAFTVAGMGTGGLKAWNSGNRIADAWTDPGVSLGNKLLETCTEGAYALEGTSKFAENAAKLLKWGDASDFFGKIAPLCKIGGGSSLAGRSLGDLLSKKQDPDETAGSVFDLFAGTFDAIGGICELGVLTAPLAVPLGLMASTFSIAGAFFRDGNLVGGIATLLIGSLITAVVSHFMKAALKKAFEALMNTVRTAFQAMNAPFFSNPVTVAAAIAVGILISTLFAQALSNLMGFAQGGFPAQGQMFIAREAGPELVGTIGSRNAVVNNDQIVEAVSIGAFQAWNAAWRDNSSSKRCITRVFLDGKQIAMSGSN